MSELIQEADLQKAIEILKPVLSTRFLRAILKKSHLEKLEGMLQTTLGHQELLEILVRQHGPMLLASPRRKIGSTETSIRFKLLETLSEETLRSLFKDLRSKDKEPATKGRVAAKLADLRWYRGSSTAFKMARALEMPDAFAGTRAVGSRQSTYQVSALDPVQPLKDYQQGIIKELRACLRKQERVMVSAFTGTGKTRMAMEFAMDRLIQEGEGCVCWIAQKAELLDQACDAIEYMWPWKAQELGEDLHIFRFLEGNRFEENIAPSRATFVVATSQQVQSRLESGDSFLLDFFSKSELLIIDEAHHSLAKGHQNIINAYENARGEQTKRVIGLSATPGRSNLSNATESRQLAEMFGRNLIVPKVPEADSALAWFQSEGYLSKIQRKQIGIQSSIKETAEQKGVEISPDIASYQEYPKEYLNVVGADPLRNKELIRELKKLANDDRHMLIFCCNIDHATLIFQALISSGVSAGLIHSKIDKRDRRHTIRRFKNQEIQALVNVEVLTTGFDAPKIDTVVFCRPTLSRILYEQMVGRGMRGPQMGGTAECLIVDFTDNIDLFNLPQGWQAFWEEWHENAELLDEETDNLWTIHEAVPESPENGFDEPLIFDDLRKHEEKTSTQELSTQP